MAKAFIRTAGETSRLRKQEHLEISLGADISSRGITTGLENYRFVHQALPEIDLEDIDVSSTLFGKPLRAPLLISSMVGGIDSASGINRNLAQAAQLMGPAMGVGSQRCMLERPEAYFSYAIRDIAPDILLFANLGAIQLNNGLGVKDCLSAVKSIEADALVLHLNPLQEALQPEGNTNFYGLLAKIEKVCREMPVPVMVKEVGWGISEEAARKLAAAGVAGIDVAGAGGTSWSRIEGMRSEKKAGPLAAAFTSWGIPTADSLLMARKGAPGIPLIGSGGIRTGLDVAKIMALGADLAGIALPLLKSAAISAEAVVVAVSEVIQGLKTAMFCTGSADLSSLKNKPCLVKATGGG